MSHPATSTSPPRYLGIVAFVLIALALLGFGVGFYRHKVREVVHEQHNLLVAIGDLKAGQLERWRMERFSDVHRVAVGPLVRKRTAEFLQAPGDAGFRADLLQQLSLNRMGDEYDCALLLSLDGRVLLSTEANPSPVAPATRRVIQAASLTEDGVLSDFFQEADDVTHIDAAATVRDPLGRPLAVVVLRAHAEAFLFPLVISRPLPSQSSETVLAVRVGDEAMVPHQLRHQAPGSPRWHQPLTHIDMPAVQAVLGKRGFFEGIDYRQQQVLGDLRELPGTPWFFIAKIDRQEALAGLRADTKFLAATLGACLLLAAAVIGFFYRGRQAKDYRARYEGEQALRIREQQLQLALSAARQGLYDLDLQTGVATVSPEYASMLGEDSAGFQETHDTWLERLHPEDREPAERAYTEYLSGLREEYRIEFRQITRTGEWKWILSLAKVVEWDAEGRPVRMLGTRTDITELKQAEAALRESEARYRAIVEWSPDTVAVIREGIVVYLNPGGVKMFGAESAADLVGRPSLERVHPDYHPQVRVRTKEITDHGIPAPMIESRYLKVDGTPMEVETQGAPIIYDGQPALVVVARDITPRKRAEKALRESEERYRAQFKLASEGIMSLSMEGEILEVNEAFARMHGYTREEMLHLPLRELDTEATFALAADRMARLAAGEALTFEVTHRHKEGRSFPLEVSASMINTAGKSALLCFHRDISERKQAEEALREQELQFRTLADTGQALIWTAGLDKGCNYFNRPWLEFTGRTLEQELGNGWAETVHPDDLARCFETYVTAFDRREKFSMDYRMLRADGKYRWIKDAGTPRYDTKGSFLGYIGHCLDITERLQAEEERAAIQAQLQQSQKMESLGNLAGGVAHDMNNVLGAILGLATAHLEIQPAGSPVYRAFDTISKAALRGGKLVKGLLGFARQRPAEIEELDMNAILLDEVRLLERTTLANVHLELDLAADLRPMLGDAGALTHAFMNLCVNAVDAMGGSGTLTLRTRNVDQAWIELRVEDTGTGMTEQVLAKAMEPFFTTKEVGKGTGLGLSMVYSTVKAHAGQIDLHSEPGQGTCVSIRFPASLPTGDLEEAPAPPNLGPEPRPSEDGLKVLLVDDDELIQASTEALLQILNHRAILATSGEAALAHLEAGLAVDVVILDVNMPGLGGGGTLPRLRALRPDLPVLLATGRADQTALDLAAAHSQVTLMPKPFSLKELGRQLESLCGKGGFFSPES